MSPDAPVDVLERLLDKGPRIPTDAWSLGDGPLRFVLGQIDAGARTILECGSGRSTIVVARRLDELDEGSIHSLEHDPSWAQRTRNELAAEKLHQATVIVAPLEPNVRAGETGSWYAREALSALPDGVDLLLIDGPPAGDPALRRNREPALAELGSRLAPGAWIVLDDARRPGEAAAVANWSREYGLEFAFGEGRGFATARWPLYVPRQV